MATTEAQDRETAAWGRWLGRTTQRTLDIRVCQAQGHLPSDHIDAMQQGWIWAASQHALVAGEAREHRAQVAENDWSTHENLPSLLEARADDARQTAADAIRWSQ